MDSRSLPGKRCVECAFYHRHQVLAIGECRFNAPEPGDGPTQKRNFPVVHENDWCGEHVFTTEKLLRAWAEKMGWKVGSRA